MCTALSYHHYFARNLDLDYHYQEEVVMTPRAFALTFRFAEDLPRHYAMVGMAHVAQGVPLYYDGVNEHGLAIAGLNFPGCAHYPPPKGQGLAPFEVIPYLLARCASVREVGAVLSGMEVVAEDFSPQMPRTPMHWLVSDGVETAAVEPLEGGLAVVDDPAGVLTNSPPLTQQLDHLSKFGHLSPRKTSLPPEPALPGDGSSLSRFVRAAFGRKYATGGEVGQVFHILDSVAQVRGCVRLDKGGEERTVYSSCCDLKEKVYYHRTYENSRLTAISLDRTNLDGCELVRYPLAWVQDIWWKN